VARPGTIPDIADGYRILAEVTKIVKRIEDVRSANALSRATVFRIMNVMGRDARTVIDRHVKRSKVADRIMDEIGRLWLDIRLD
jgi:hypothetical protein